MVEAVDPLELEAAHSHSAGTPQPSSCSATRRISGTGGGFSAPAVVRPRWSRILRIATWSVTNAISLPRAETRRPHHRVDPKTSPTPADTPTDSTIGDSVTIVFHPAHAGLMHYHAEFADPTAFDILVITGALGLDGASVAIRAALAIWHPRPGGTGTGTPGKDG